MRIVRLRYHDGSNKTVSLEIPLADEVLALFLLGSFLDNWETLVVTLELKGNILTLDMLKSSILN